MLRRATGIVLAVLVLGAAGFAGWRAFAAPDAAPPPATVAVDRTDIETTVLASGTIEARQLVSVGAQVSGQVKTLAVELGDTVKQGQLIAEIDSVPQQNALRNAEAALATVRAQHGAQVAALEQSELAFKRQQQLLNQQATSRQDFEQARAALAAARGQVAALEAQIAQATITVDTARVNLGYTRIAAPIDGTVVAVVTLAGQTVNANQQAPTLIKLAQLDTLTVKAQISEADVIRVRPDQKVYFTILGDPDRRRYAALRAVEPAPDSIRTESSTASSSTASASAAVYYNGLFDVPNPDGQLRIAMTAQVYIVLAEAQQALRVPAAAVRPRGAAQGPAMVQVLGADGQVQPRRIRVGLNNHVDVEVVEGLQEGEQVVLPGSGGPPSGMAGGAQRGPRTPGTPGAGPRHTPPRMGL